MSQGNGGWGARTAYAMPVTLNVYDLSEGNELLSSLGLGLYHSGVVVNGEEYTFASGQGVFTHPPGQAGYPLRFTTEPEE